jgi:hypothetical protein
MGDAGSLAKNGIVETPYGWRKFAQQFPTTELHALKPTDLKSASKVEPVQYAAFRVLWKMYTVNPSHDKVFGGVDIAKAEAILEDCAPWKRYLAAVKATSPALMSMGPFAIVLMNQEQACETKVDRTRPKIHNDIPMTRSRTAQQAQAAAAGTAVLQDPPEALHEAVARGPLDAIDQGFDDDDEGLIGTGDPFVTPLRPAKAAKAALLTPITPASNVSLGLDAFPKIDDENVVNKALVDLLQAIALVGYEADVVRRSAQWSMRREAFHVKGNRKRPLYEAQVDGVLLDEIKGKQTEKRTRVILEVKPNLRADNYHTRYQEAAQVVAWIASEHSDEDPSWYANKDGMYR